MGEEAKPAEQPTPHILRRATEESMQLRREQNEDALPDLEAWARSATPTEIARRILAGNRRAERAEYWADLDTLTNLPRRETFFKKANAEIEKAIQNPQTKGVRITIEDIDNFKEYNSKYGLSGGDKALRSVAQNLLAATRDRPEGIDTPARYGGEELAIVMPFEVNETPFEQRVNSAERIRSASCVDVDMGHVQVPVRLSAGTTEYRVGETFQECFDRAGRAQIAAKRLGKNRTVSSIVTDIGEEFCHDLETGKIYKVQMIGDKPDEFELVEAA